MRTITRSIIFYCFALYIVSETIKGLKVDGGFQTIVIGGAIFAFLSLVLKPVLRAIAFPLTILTLGLFSFVINAVILFLLTKIITKIHVMAFTLQKISLGGFKISSYHFNSIFAFIFISAIISLLVGVFSWLTKE